MAVAEHEALEPRGLRLAPPPLPEPPASGLLPTEQLTVLLAHYRRHGVPFDDAWALAVGHAPGEGLIRWPSSRRDAADWRKVVDATREGWRASYNRWEPEPREAAAAELYRILTQDLRESA